MGHWGNTPADLVEQVVNLHRHIGDQSYVATSVDRHGKLEFSIHLADWEDRTRLSLLIEAGRFLWRAIYRKANVGQLE